MTWIDHALLEQIWAAVGGPPALLQDISFRGDRVISSQYPVADLASATVGAAGLALAEFAATSDQRPVVAVNRGLAGAWFGASFRPDGWKTPALWDPIAGDYRCADGWVRLHTNAPKHRIAALWVLGIADSVDKPAERSSVASAVVDWRGEALESAVVAAGGCAAELRSPEAWHNSAAREEEPIVSVDFRGARPEQTFWGPGHRLAGPVTVGPAEMSWSIPAAPFGSTPAAWVPTTVQPA